jgi:predicted nucleic acid-binding protein
MPQHPALADVGRPRHHERMTRYAVDAAVALRIVSEPLAVAPGHQLVGPAVLRSHALATLYRDVRAGRLEEAEGRRLLEGIAALKIRLLGDRVSRAVAWRIAADNDWDDTAFAEYLAVASLQADALVTEDPHLAAAAEGIVPVAPVSALTA